MNATLKYATRFALAVSLFLFAVAPYPGEGSAGEVVSPVLVGTVWEATDGGTLLGGLSEGKPVDIFHGLSIEGAPLAAGSGCPDVGENPSVTTPLLQRDLPLVFYTLSGEELGSGTVESVAFMCMEVNGQAMLSPRLANVKAKKREYEGPWLGLATAMPFAPVPTEKKESADGSFAFEAKGGQLRVVFSKVLSEGEELFTAVLHHNSQERKLFDLPAGEAEEGIAAGFIDIAADGSPEFLFVSEGPAGRMAIYPVGKGAEAARWIVDTGE